MFEAHLLRRWPCLPHRHPVRGWREGQPGDEASGMLPSQDEHCGPSPRPIELREFSILPLNACHQNSRWTRSRLIWIAWRASQLFRPRISISYSGIVRIRRRMLMRRVAHEAGSAGQYRFAGEPREYELHAWLQYAGTLLAVFIIALDRSRTSSSS